MFIKTKWTVTADYQSTAAGKQFASLEQALSFTGGEVITADSESQVRKAKIDNMIVFVKCYFRVRGLRSWLGFSRIRGEWKNLLFFKKINIPTANIIAYGETYCLGHSFRGALITEGLKNVYTLSDLFATKHNLLQNHHWLLKIIAQLAKITRIMHLNRFAHNDLKWRNILVTSDLINPQVYLIDCPLGMKWSWPFLSKRLVKDLACLDKVGKQCLSNTMRMRFYKQYRQTDRLSNKDKRMIKQIIHYFRGKN